MFTLRFKTDNDAFQCSHPEIEVKQILEYIAERVNLGSRLGNILDVYGNKVGTWKWTDR